MFIIDRMLRLTGLLVLLVAIAGGGFLVVLFTSEGLQDTVVRRMIAQVVVNDRTPNYGKDAIDVVFCGTASPAGATTRAQQCIAVFAGDKFFIVDTGARSATRAAALGLPVGRLNGVLFTHFHSDHIAALGEFQLASWARGRQGKLNVYGGPGVKKVTEGFEQAYSQDYKYRTDHHGEKLLPIKSAGYISHTVEVPEYGGRVIYDRDGLKISAFRVLHPPISPAYGYRFDYKERSVVVSGDTTKSTNLVQVSQGADVLIHEVLQPALITTMSEVLTEAGRRGIGQIIKDTLTYHTSPEQAAEVAVEANVDMLVFTHFAPVPANALLERIFMRGVAEIRPEGAVLADDGMHIHLPSGAGALQIMQR